LFQVLTSAIAVSFNDDFNENTHTVVVSENEFKRKHNRKQGILYQGMTEIHIQKFWFAYSSAWILRENISETSVI
jgi:hypothetical protein